MKLLALLLAATMPLPADVTAIWAVNDGEKVDRDDLANPNKKANSAWTGGRVRLFGARNEVIAFQVIVEAGATGIESLSASLPALKHEAFDASIVYSTPGSDPSNSVDRPIQLFSVNYMQVTEPSDAARVYRPGSASAPANPTGWKPVQLVPENARAGLGGFPLKVAPRHNQAIWIEIYTVPRQAAGLYRGDILVRADGVETRLPVSLEVFDFVLPAANSLQAMFYYDPSQPRLYQGRDDLDPVYHRFAHRHRIELVQDYSEETAAKARPYVDGSAFTREQGYEGPGAGAGNVIAPRSLHSAGPEFDDPESARRAADTWVQSLTGFNGYTFLWLADDPSPRDYPRIRGIVNSIKSHTGPGKALPLLVAGPFVLDLQGLIDVWMPAVSQFHVGMAQSVRWQGRHYWTYNGGRPHGGAIAIDAPATDPRAMIWICYSHSIALYHYWHTVHWRHDARGQTPARNQNVWANPITFDQRGAAGGGPFANGDGVLLYPGTDVLFPENDRGIAGPISTVQLANFRRGLQDHLYLTTAVKLGLSRIVLDLLFELVPRVLSRAPPNKPVDFAERSKPFESARYRLATAIAARLADPSSTPPPLQ